MSDGHSCRPGQEKPSICLTQIFTAHTVGLLNVSCLMHLKPKLEIQHLGYSHCAWFRAWLLCHTISEQSFFDLAFGTKP